MWSFKLNLFTNSFPHFLHFNLVEAVSWRAGREGGRVSLRMISGLGGMVAKGFGGGWSLD